MERGSGILMPVSSLPSPYGIGTLGKSAEAYIDFLARAGQSWWQILPVGPTSAGDSPYQSPSAYAGNPYFIDLDLLIEDGHLTKEEVQEINWGEDPACTDYGLLYRERIPLLSKAAERGRKRDREKVLAFAGENASWLPDYTMFMALKRHFGMRPWTEWPDEDLRMHRAEALAVWRDKLDEEIWLFTYLQYLFFKQWNSLRKYARSKNIKILGDIALYVALDSADVWSSPENFLLDKDHRPSEVAGVPPDLFSDDGQLWGNPLYDYAHMRQDGFSWWVQRIGGAAKLYDAIRIDHFRGIESYWAVPASDTTAKNGRWVKGPGMDLIGTLKTHFPDIQFIAEDLGYPTKEVEQLLSNSGFPGMKLLVFAFDRRNSGGSMPHSYKTNSICYTGTHDNETLNGWIANADLRDLAKARVYLGLNEEEGYARGFFRGGMSSVSCLFIAQMQDYLELGNEARMNTPGTMSGNWRWRMLPGQDLDGLADRIREMTILYGRNQDHG